MELVWFFNIVFISADTIGAFDHVTERKISVNQLQFLKYSVKHI